MGLLALSNLYVALITFTLAYVAGYAMTVGPLMQEGVALKEALVDAFYSETASITVMEIGAIGTDLWLAGEPTMGEVLFWTSLVFSLSLGLLAAYPVNVLLVKFGGEREDDESRDDCLTSVKRIEINSEHRDICVRIPLESVCIERE